MPPTPRETQEAVRDVTRERPAGCRIEIARCEGLRGRGAPSASVATAFVEVVWRTALAVAAAPKAACTG